MILLVVLAVLLVAAAGAGLLGAGLLSDDRRRGRAGIAALLPAPVVLVAGVLLLGVLVLGVDGGATGGGRPAPAPAPEAPAATLPLARLQPSVATIPVVRIRPDEDDSFTAYEPVAGLAPGGAVRVRAEGFGWADAGAVRQCVLELGRQTACGPPLPVAFDDGEADFQVAVHDDIAPGRCRAGQATCLLRLTSDAGRSGSVQLVFVDPVRVGHVVVEPARGLVKGQAVDVSVTGFPARATATAVLCAPPAPYDARRCAPPDPAAAFTTDAAGAGSTRLTVGPGQLGPDRATCGPRRPCGVAVVTGDGFVSAPVALLTFSAGPGPAYDPGRLVPGLAVALALVAAAVALARRTDWSRPGEAATPELDRADLRAGSSLDELFGTEAELDERDPVPW